MTGGSARVLALVTDAYGGTGGIAQYNRDFLECVAAHRLVTDVVVVPRVISRDVQDLPQKVTHCATTAGSKARFLRAVAKLSSPREKFDLVICAHVNLLPAAWLAARRLDARLLVLVYGLEVWTRGSRLQRHMLRSADAVVSISSFTLDKLRKWAAVALDRTFLVPNAIDLSIYTPGQPSEALRQRFGFGQGPVITTLGRMDENERAKGFDEILEVLPSLLEDFPTLTYCAAGDGTDMVRLQRKAEKLGVRGHTVFTGYVPEEMKLDLYRATDLFVMPSRLEGFGYVFLEALATGIPVIASSIDGSREAVRDGAWGLLADPDNRDEILRAIRRGLTNPVLPDRSELEYFSKSRFRERVWQTLERTMGRVPSGFPPAQ
jgi:phosphatidylinositol alpha-1,6-mannosyltransferase